MPHPGLNRWVIDVHTTRPLRSAAEVVAQVAELIHAELDRDAIVAAKEARRADTAYFDAMDGVWRCGHCGGQIMHVTYRSLVNGQDDCDLHNALFSMAWSHSTNWELDHPYAGFGCTNCHGQAVFPDGVTVSVDDE